MQQVNPLILAFISLKQNWKLYKGYYAPGLALIYRTNVSNLGFKLLLNVTYYNDPPKMEPRFLNVTHYNEVVESGVPFARKFRENEPLLDKIDDKILRHWWHRPVPGAWCIGRRRWFGDPCSQWSNVNIVRPGPQAEKFHRYMVQILEESKSTNNSCAQ